MLMRLVPVTISVHMIQSTSMIHQFSVFHSTLSVLARSAHFYLISEQIKFRLSFDEIREWSILKWKSFCLKCGGNSFQVIWFVWANISIDENCSTLINICAYFIRIQSIMRSFYELFHARIYAGNLIAISGQNYLWSSSRFVLILLNSKSKVWNCSGFRLKLAMILRSAS